MTNATTALDFETARKAMIDSQLRTSGVNEEFVLSRMMAVGRENFLPPDKAPLAYIDRSITLEGDNHLGSPLFYGKMLLEAVPDKSDTVLIIDGGTGYLSKLIEPAVSDITSVNAAHAHLSREVKEGAYSLILVDGAIEEMPQWLSNGLAENGRIVCGLLLRQVTRLASGRKISGHTALQVVEDLGIPVLPQFNKAKAWSFT